MSAKNIPMRVRVDLSHFDLETLVMTCEYVQECKSPHFTGRGASLKRVENAGKLLLKESSLIVPNMQAKLDALEMKHKPSDKELHGLHRVLRKKSVDHKRGYLKGLQDVLVALARGDTKEIRRLENFLNLNTQAFGN